MRYDHLHSELEKRGYELIKRDVQNGVVRRVVYDLDGEPSNIITFPLDREPNGIITVDDMIADAIVGRLKKQDAWK